MPAITHGFTRGRKVPSWYRAWYHMKDRCTNKNNKDWHHYGGRGIKVCDRWLTSSNFFKDMGEKPSSLHSIERVNNNKGYEPGNCVWATKKEQGRNKRNNRNYTYNGETRCLKDWAEHVGLSYRVLYMRLRLGWKFEVAITQPVVNGKPLRTRKT